MARRHRRRRDAGKVDETETLDGHRFTIEPWRGRQHAALVVVATIVPVFLAIQFGTDARPPWWMFALLPVWIGMPSALSLTVSEAGLKIDEQKNLLGRMASLFAADALASVREAYGRPDGVFIPWEAIDGVDAREGRRNRRDLILDLGGERLELEVVVRSEDGTRFDRLCDQLAVRSGRVERAQIPEEVEALRSKRVAAKASPPRVG